MSYPEKVKIVEVGPRDGLQNESVTVPAEVKVTLVEKLADAGVSVIECGAFVSPKWVPQMATSAEVFRRIEKRAGLDQPAVRQGLRRHNRARTQRKSRRRAIGLPLHQSRQDREDCGLRLASSRGR